MGSSMTQASRVQNGLGPKMAEFANLNSAKKGPSKKLHGAPLIDAGQLKQTPSSRPSTTRAHLRPSRRRRGGLPPPPLRAHLPRTLYYPPRSVPISPAPRPPSRRSNRPGPTRRRRHKLPVRPSPRRNVKVRP